MQSGTVKWFNAAKGYGFITPTTGEDLFVHFKSILSEGYKTLKKGESVEFGIQETSKGAWTKCSSCNFFMGMSNEEWHRMESSPNLNDKIKKMAIKKELVKPLP